VNVGRLFRLLFAVVGLAVGAWLAGQAAPALAPLLAWPRPLAAVAAAVAGAAVGALAGVVAGGVAVRWEAAFRTWIFGRLARVSLMDAAAAAGGALVGLAAGALLAVPASGLRTVGAFLSLLLSVVLGYAGLLGGLRLRDQLPALEIWRGHGRAAPGRGSVKILDTSVIIDGRIADLCRTGFLEGTLVVPGFVLEELRHIADSADPLRRNRGRRGLDVLHQIQHDRHIQLQVVERDVGDPHAEVDTKLLRLARALGGKVVTNDFNLNKVAELHGVPVLNINELANAIKPVVLPGEEMVVRVIKDGKEVGQGVAYLDDGTMIVVDGGKKYIGDTVGVLVTSVLQTAAGRMIFAKPKAVEAPAQAQS
jgi:uncharacterized protein YacL